MFENIDFSKMGEMLESVKEKARQIEEESARAEFEVKAGGGLVKVKVNGALEVVDIEIDDELLEDKQSMQILLMAAINDAMKLAAEEKKKAAANALGLGGLGGLKL